jgi:hypothetical protein
VHRGCSWRSPIPHPSHKLRPSPLPPVPSPIPFHPCRLAFRLTRARRSRRRCGEQSVTSALGAMSAGPYMSSQCLSVRAVPPQCQVLGRVLLDHEALLVICYWNKRDGCIGQTQLLRTPGHRPQSPRPRRTTSDEGSALGLAATEPAVADRARAPAHLEEEVNLTGLD